MKILLLLNMLLFIAGYAFCDDYSVRWDVKDILNEIYFSDNIGVVKQEGTPVYYSIARKRAPLDENTDLYLSFDEDHRYDFLQNYRITNARFKHNFTRGVIDESGFFYHEDDLMELNGNSNSFFQPGVNLGSFTTSFWIYPVGYSNNDILMKIGSQYYDNERDAIEAQSIIIKLSEGRVIWEFNNIFQLNDYKKERIVLESYERLVPSRWNQVMLQYDRYSGELSISINGIQSALVLATLDGSYNSSVLNLHFHEKNRCSLHIAPSFTGSLDEFYITKKVESIDMDRYVQGGGEIISRVKRIDSLGGFITGFDIEDTQLDRSKILYYCRYSSQPFSPDDNYSPEIKWIPFTPENMPGHSVKYFQWRALFLPGTDNKSSPKLRGINLSYRKDYPPSKPIGLKILADDGKISVKWLLNSEKDLKGYKIYYGTSSGEYFGKESDKGISPIDVGLVTSYEITGLKNNMIYYVVVTAYDDKDGNHESGFSEEVFARPIGKL